MTSFARTETAIRAFAAPLTTGRLRLRRVFAGDVDALIGDFADWEVVRWLARPVFPVRRAEMAEHYLGAEDRQRAGSALMLVIDGPEGPMGTIDWRLSAASHVQVADGSNIGFWLGRRFWGQGYMSEAAAALVRHIFAVTDENAIYAGVFDGNGASLRVQEKLGFRIEGRAMVWSTPNLASLPHINTKLTRPDWARIDP